MADLDIRLLDAGFDPGEALSRFAVRHKGAGAIASFTGQVRGEQDVHLLELLHYAPLTLPGMEDLARDAARRFAISGLLAWHRIGQVRPGKAVVLVAAAATHRRAAFDAVDFTMDHLKSQAWFWKRERRSDGWHWIEPRDQDHADRQRWRENNAV